MGLISGTDIAKQVSLPQPTIIRILETLISAGYIYRLEGSALYGVTARTLALSRGSIPSRLVHGHAHDRTWHRDRLAVKPATFDHGGMTIATPTAAHSCRSRPARGPYSGDGDRGRRGLSRPSAAGGTRGRPRATEDPHSRWIPRRPCWQPLIG
jgi:hypothetical protein